MGNEQIAQIFLDALLDMLNRDEKASYLSPGFTWRFSHSMPEPGGRAVYSNCLAFCQFSVFEDTTEPQNVSDFKGGFTSHLERDRAPFTLNSWQHHVVPCTQCLQVAV